MKDRTLLLAVLSSTCALGLRVRHAGRNPRLALGKNSQEMLTLTVPEPRPAYIYEQNANQVRSVAVVFGTPTPGKHLTVRKQSTSPESRCGAQFHV